MRSLLCASVCVFYFSFPLFSLFFQAISSQLPHAGSSDIHFSSYPPFLPPSPRLYPQRSPASIWADTLTSLYCFSSSSLQSTETSPSQPPPTLISNNQTLSLRLSLSWPRTLSLCVDFSLCPWWTLCVIGVLYDFLCVCSVLVVLSLSCRIVVVLCPSILSSSL